MKGEMDDAEVSEKQLSRCEEMVRYSLERCERKNEERERGRKRDRPHGEDLVIAKPNQLLSRPEAREAHY